ncbi:MAG: esterase family protein [Lachnospiraceae bacterium]|nr:esterase family protein [Lachnospiraceae bacterium]MCH4069981.1 esterase family protein [Lachnospiraceae bacterium]MCH4108666.1 esterase family protein [Lachnospiraceae bacterium]MCI1302817.1 esterase family protein [Lachnospiraceae bacterium]MCI1332046.1 esterase family protein [Lachnospiraceae bacterium]
MRENRIWKRRAAAALAAAVSAALLTGCGAVSPDTGTAGTMSASAESESQSSQETTAAAAAQNAAPKVVTPAYTKDLAPLAHGDTSQIAQTIVYGSGGAYDDTDFSVPDGYGTERDDVTYGDYIADLTYYSQAAGMEKTFNIVLPAGYDESQSYPVLYLLHGYGGDSNEWNAARVVCGNLQAAGQMPPCIIVQPDEWTSQNSKDGAGFSDWISAFAAFSDDLTGSLMPYIEENYAAATGKENTAVLGLSMGGWQALSIAFHNPGLFGYVGALAPMVGALDTSITRQFMSSDLSKLDMEDPDDIPYYIMQNYGTEEPWDKEATDEYRKSMTENGIPNAFYIIEGTGHDGNTWVPGLYNFAGRIFRN